MTKRITITVPDELHEKMEKWKDSFNFSGVFQEAIGEKIQRKEAFQERLKGDSDMEAIVERLRQEKMESTGNYFDFGKNEGLNWAKAAHYDEIQLVLAWEPQHTEDPTRLNVEGMEGIEEYFSEIIENDPFMGFHEIQGWANEFIDRFVEGFKEGVEEFWNEIEGKLQ